MNCNNYYIYTLVVLSVAVLFFTNISYAQYARLENKPYIHPELNFKVRLFKDWSLISPSSNEPNLYKMVLKQINISCYRQFSEHLLAETAWALSIHRFSIKDRANSSCKKPTVFKAENQRALGTQKYSARFGASQTFKDMLKKLDICSFPELFPLERTTFLSRQFNITTLENVSGSLWHFEKALPKIRNTHLSEINNQAKIYTSSIIAASLRSNVEEYGFLFICPSYKFKEAKQAFIQLVKSFVFPKEQQTNATSGRSPNATKNAKDDSSQSTASEAAGKPDIAKRILTRKKERELLIEKAINQLPEEWKVIHTKHFVILSNASRSYTSKIIRKIEGIRRWLDKNLDDITEMPALTGIVRISANYREHLSYHDAFVDSFYSFYSSITKEALIYRGPQKFPKLYHLSKFCTGILAQWLEDKYDDLYFETPLWLSTGLGRAFASARVYDKGLKFIPSTEDEETLMKNAKKGKIYALRNLFQLSFSEFWKHRTLAVCQSAHVVRYLIGPKAHSTTLYNFLAEYLKHTICSIEQKRLLKKEEPPNSNEPKSDSDSENSNQMRIDMVNFVTRQTFESVFSDWSKDDWDRLNSKVMFPLK